MCIILEGMAMMFFNQLFEKYAEEMKKINTWKIFVSSKQLKGKTLPVYLPIWSKELAGLKLFFLCIYMDEKNVEDPFQGDMIVYTEAKVYRFIKLEKWSPFKVKLVGNIRVQDSCDWRGVWTCAVVAFWKQQLQLEKLAKFFSL